MAVQTYTASGSKAAKPAKLDSSIFGVEVKNHQLLRQAYDAYLANGRDNLAVTKTRGLVRGGGKKPWKQKGTGRARFGSSRNPIWRGGGIVFGPTGEENYTKKLPVASKRLAIRQALSIASTDDKIVVIEKLSVKDGKTAELVKLLNKVGAKRTTLIIVAEKSTELTRAAANLGGVSVSTAKYLNVYTTLNADTIVFTTEALKITTEWLSGGEK